MAVTIRKRFSSPNLMANCQPTDVVGDVVYVAGDMISGLYQVSRVDYVNSSKMPGFGVIVKKFSTTVCEVQVGGPITDLYAGLTPGKYCFVGADGRLTQTVPSTPTTGVRYSQPIAYAIASNAVLLEFQVPTVRHL